jgi:protein gp37
VSATSKIEWTDRTWNPTRGCSIVSPGCVNCYAMKQAHRFSGPGRPYEGLTKLTERSGPQWTGVVRTVEDALLEPLAWRPPARVFVNSMSDLFHEDVPDQFIVDVFGIMALAHWHTFQVLTKRADRMRAFLAAGDHGIVRQFEQIQAGGGIGPRGLFKALDIKRRDGVGWKWPLQNVWLGVSAEDQPRANERIPQLLKTPAAVRFVSIEPQLGPIDLEALTVDIDTCDEGCGEAIRYSALQPFARCACCVEGPEAIDWPSLDWVIVGGESGPGARPFDLTWARSIVAQCKASDVPVFVKQLGARPYNGGGIYAEQALTAVDYKDRKGGDPAEWPADLRVREFPKARA